MRGVPPDDVLTSGRTSRSRVRSASGSCTPNLVLEGPPSKSRAPNRIRKNARVSRHFEVPDWLTSWIPLTNPARPVCFETHEGAPRPTPRHAFAPHPSGRGRKCPPPRGLRTVPGPKSRIRPGVQIPDAMHLLWWLHGICLTAGNYQSRLWPARHRTKAELLPYRAPAATGAQFIFLPPSSTVAHTLQTTWP